MSFEEHGPYLPAFTDGYMNLDMAERIAQEIVKRPGMQVLIFALILLGNGGANKIGRKYIFSGTFTLRFSTLRAPLMDISSEIGDQGFRKIFVVHMHDAPNHKLATDQAADYFNDTYHGHMVNIWNLAINYRSPALSDAREKEKGFTVHAGLKEHIMLYYLKPEFQQLAYASAAPVTAASPNDLATLARQNNRSGYWGSPRNASLALGKKTWRGWVEAILPQVNAILDNKFDFSKPCYYQLASADSAQKSVNEDALRYDQEKEARQGAWLKRKGLKWWYLFI